MKLHEDLEIGAATHTGQVRSTNEDDFLVLAPMTVEEVRARGRLLAVADGMGGVAGGAEASRAAVRSLATSFLDGGADREPVARLCEAFRAASRTVHALSQEIPALREMGTTLTAAILHGDRLIFGHVGDSRCYLLRQGVLRQLTTDHAVREPESYLTACIGGGQESVEPEVGDLTLRPGDLVVLLTDGLWSVVDDAGLQKVLSGNPPQAAAEALLAAANAGGGPDNCTVVVARVRRPGADPGALREVELPRVEQRLQHSIAAPPIRLAAPRWPWPVLVLALALAGLGLLRLFRGIDLGDLIGWLGSRFL